MLPLQALEVDDMTDIREMVDDYIERNQESVEEFENPDEIYAEIVDQLDSLEVRLCFTISHFAHKELLLCLTKQDTTSSRPSDIITQGDCNCRRKYQWQWRWHT